MSDLSVEIAGIKLRNPVMVASGTFGSGQEYSEFVEPRRLGAIVTKTLTLKEKEGNRPPRLCETPSGILNSIGLQNKGVDYFIEKELPWLEEQNVPLIVSFGGTSLREYLEVAAVLSQAPGISALEMNISCPNVKAGGMAFGSSREKASELVRAVRKIVSRPLIVKLTPNVTDIVEIAKACEETGADALSLINTILGMVVDVETFKPKLATFTGGLSGPAIRPVAVRMVWQVAQAVKVPIIGMGGIMTAEDAVEFLLAGATAVAVGTANFTDPMATLEIISGLEAFLERKNIKSIKSLIGRLKIRD